jgi:hypothetical protein
MRTKDVNARPNWRCRREEYLRATGRCDELINEGYEAPAPSTQWILLPGGRHGNREERPGAMRFCLMKGARP